MSKVIFQIRDIRTANMFVTFKMISLGKQVSNKQIFMLSTERPVVNKICKLLGNCLLYEKVVS